MNDKAKSVGHPYIPERKKIPAMKYHDKRAKMKAMFGAGAEKFVDCGIAMFGSIDIIAFDDWLKEKFGDYEDGNTSMAEFVTRQFGADASRWLKRNMDSVK